jgi:hypothetical protein
LSQRFDRKIYPVSRRDTPCSGSGTYREFSRATINQIAIAEKLIELGVGVGRAIAAAQLFTETGQPGRAANELFEFGLTAMIHSESGTSIRNIDPDSSLSEVFGRSFEPAIILNVGPIIRTVHEAIISNQKDTK